MEFMKILWKDETRRRTDDSDANRAMRRSMQDARKEDNDIIYSGNVRAAPSYTARSHRWA